MLTAYFICKVWISLISGFICFKLETIELLLTAFSLLIRADDYWWVWPVVGRKVGLLRAKVGEADLTLPPVQGWEYYDAGKWQSDPTMECSREVSPASLC